jgi:pentatricopeptide repeat protein
MREVIDVMMAKAKLKPDVVTYTMLVSRLRMEGDDAAAESVVEEMKKAGVEPNERTLEILNLPSQGEILGRMRTGLIRGLLQQGRESEKAAAMVCRDLHERRLMQGTFILQIMIDHCVNSDFEWPVAADEGALMWYYYMRKSKNAFEIREEHSEQTHNREVIDLHNCTRGLASVTLVLRLLRLRSKWIEADPDADIGKEGVVVIVGKGNRTAKGKVPVLKDFAMRLLNGRLNLAAVVDPSNCGRLLIEKKTLLRWFESDQALVWSREVSQLNDPEGDL